MQGAGALQIINDFESSSVSGTPFHVVCYCITGFRPNNDDYHCIIIDPLLLRGPIVKRSKKHFIMMTDHYH